MRARMISLGFAFAATSAFADGSYPLQDGVNRAPAVTLHCMSASGSAVPCGISGNPLAVTPAAGGATSSNQALQVVAEQASAQGIGTVADGAYVGGSGSLTSLLKGIWVVLSGGVAAVPIGGAPTSRSATLFAQQSTAVFPPNAQRRYMAFQVPQNTSVWVNFTGGTAAPNGLDCVYFPAGTLYESGQWVNRGTVTIYAPIAVAVSAWEN